MKREVDMLKLHGNFARPNSWQWAKVISVLVTD